MGGGLVGGGVQLGLYTSWRQPYYAPEVPNHRSRRLRRRPSTSYPLLTIAQWETISWGLAGQQHLENTLQHLELWLVGTQLQLTLSRYLMNCHWECKHQVPCPGHQCSPSVEIVTGMKLKYLVKFFSLKKNSFIWKFGFSLWLIFHPLPRKHTISIVHGEYAAQLLVIYLSYLDK